MQFKNIIFFVFVAVATAVAIPVPGGKDAPKGDQTSCSAFNYCCNPTSVNPTKGDILSGVLNGLQLTCIDPTTQVGILPIGIGQKSTCDASVVCCSKEQKVNQHGLVNIFFDNSCSFNNGLLG